jgi:hypothetical protein
VLNDIAERNAGAFQAVQATYDLYRNGYYFLDNLGLGYGLSLQMDNDDGSCLTEEKRSARLRDFYPKILTETRKVLDWLDETKIALTGEEDEIGRMGFIDRRSDAEKKPTAYREFEPSRSPRRLSAWDRIKKAWGLSTTPEKVARAAFVEDHPDEHVAWTSLAADETGRFVVGVFYGNTRPPRAKFYEVAKSDGIARQIADDAPYSSKTWI